MAPQGFGITRLGTTDDLAGLIAFMVSPRGRWLHGATIDIDGGEVQRRRDPYDLRA